jgi:uncharacterized LabA/DUF88 family protein
LTVPVVPAAQAPVTSSPARGRRVRVFIDFWNIVLSIKHKDPSMNIDWAKLPRWLAARGATEAGITDPSYEGAHVFASYNPATDASLHRWLTGWLNAQTGVQVTAKERRPRNAPKCPVCHDEVTTCPACGGSMAGTVEKGVDTAIAVAMIRLAWEDTFDVAVLATSDRDLIPAVEFLDLRGRKVVQAGFPPSGAELTRACWGGFDVGRSLEEFRRRT